MVVFQSHSGRILIGLHCLHRNRQRGATRDKQPSSSGQSSQTEYSNAGFVNRMVGRAVWRRVGLESGNVGSTTRTTTTAHTYLYPPLRGGIVFVFLCTTTEEQKATKQDVLLGFSRKTDVRKTSDIDLTCRLDNRFTILMRHSVVSAQWEQSQIDERQ